MKTYWARELAQKIIKQKGAKLILATGISPSGPIHIGNMREVLTADLVRIELEKLNAKVKFIYIEDDFDRLRKLYPFLPKSFKKYIGQPLSNIPDPQGDNNLTYADRFIKPFFKVLDQIGIKVKTFSAIKMYQQGFYTKKVKIALQKKNEIKKILENISGRQIPKNWSPFSPLCKKCGKIDEAKIIKEDLKKNRVKYKCKCGYEDWADYSRGEGKLLWRIDWPARWSEIPINVEPYGKEHATIGGSYDTGKAICEKIFNSSAPFGINYDLIYLKGSKGKMSSSVGNVVSAEEFLQIVPPEILRYMFARTKYNKPIYFDPGIGLLQLIDEYTRLEQKCKDNLADKLEQTIYKACQIKREGKSIIPVPFKHLINAVQTARGNLKEIKRLLNRTGFKQALKNEKLLIEQIARVQNWLEKYAPENIKFSIQEKTPKIKLTQQQKQLLTRIADKLEQEDLNAEKLHNFIYELGKKLNLKPRETFQPIYQCLIAKTSGPKAGWFIILLNKKFVINRFRKVAK